METCPIWVIRVAQIACQPHPLYLEQQTSAHRPRMSESAPIPDQLSVAIGTLCTFEFAGA